MSETLTIAGRLIGPGHPPYVIAEMSGNHNGSLERAIELLQIAADAGADAVKLQTYTADTITIDHDGPEFRITGGPWDGYNLHQLYEWAHTPWEWQKQLFEVGRELGIAVFSSPFDETAVDFLQGLNAPAYKIASFEAIDTPLIEYVAARGKPMVISTGMANLKEIEESIAAARRGGCTQLALLHCISGYPTPVEEANLRTMCDLETRFGTVVGISDHTLGVHVSVAAVALGASIVEKHYTLRRDEGGPDAGFSLEPDELRTLVTGVRAAWEARGTVDYERSPSEQANAVFRRSLYVVKDIATGERLTRDNIRSIRPGYGLAPKHLPEILGATARTNLTRGTPLDWDHIEVDR